MNRYDWTGFDTKVFEEIWRLLRERGGNQVPQRDLLDFIEKEVGCSRVRAFQNLSRLVRKEPKLVYRKDNRPWRDLKIRVWLVYTGEVPEETKLNLIKANEEEEKKVRYPDRVYGQKPIPLKTSPFRKRT